MAGASMNDIKARMRSVSNTMQITKAMELVATSKLRHAKEQAEHSRAFREALFRAIPEIAVSEAVRESVWFSGKEDAPTLYIVIAGDRGLAGGFNSNIFRLAAAKADENALFLPIGKKATDHFRYKALPTYRVPAPVTADVHVGGAFHLSAAIAEDFAAGKIGRVVLVYTRFVSMMTQAPTTEVLLPLSALAEEKAGDPLYEGDGEELIAKIVPDCLGGAIHAAVCESLASESAARRAAMNSANKNAEEMILDLNLKFNRARQAVITQEITEIVSGAEAL